MLETRLQKAREYRDAEPKFRAMDPLKNYKGYYDGFKEGKNGFEGYQEEFQETSEKPKTKSKKGDE